MNETETIKRARAALCPCGCEQIPPLNDKGKRPLMCAKAWASMPAGLRREFVTADCVENRRAAAGQMLRILKQRLGKGESGNQMVFEL